MDFLKVLAAMLIAAGATYGVMYSSWTETALFRFFAACTTGILVYLLTSVMLRLIDKSDISRLFMLSRKLWR
jgi:stage V sporulation protein B